MDPEGEKLLQRFRARKRLTGSQLKTQIPLARELVAAGEVVELDAFYLAGTEPTIDTERSRIEAKTLKQAKLFAPASLLPRHRSLKALATAAIEQLKRDRLLIQLPVSSNTTYLIHAEHVLNRLGHPTAEPLEGSALPQEKTMEGIRQSCRIPAPDPAAAGRRPPLLERDEAMETSALSPSDEPFPAIRVPSKSEEIDQLTPRITEAYLRIAARSGRRSIYISDLRSEAGLALEQLKEWIQETVINRGLGQVDEGDWAAATSEQRAAAVEHWGRQRLYISLEP